MNIIIMNCIADFVALTEELRKIFGADITIWMNTIKESKYQDTNTIFEEPNTNIVIQRIGICEDNLLAR